jgi:hypothetical protein
MNNQQWPGADFCNDVHRPHAIHVDIRSEIGDADCYRREWEGGR